VVDSPALKQAKAALRSELRAQRTALDARHRAREQAHIERVLAERLPPQAHQIVASYAALSDEVCVDAWHALWWAAGLPVWLPRVVGPGVLSWHPVTDPAHLIRGAYGIREPDALRVPAAPLPPLATVVVPGIGFTRDGWRLGQGGGFYDRVLAAHSGQTVGIAFACQRVAEVPHGEHDYRVHEVLFGD